MSDSGWHNPILQYIGTRVEIMAELYPRVYLLLVTGFAVTGYACLLLFPLLALVCVAGMYQSLTAQPGIAWPELLAWMFMAGFCCLVSYRSLRFRPAPPVGIKLEKRQAPALFQLVDDTVEHFSSHGIDRIVVTGAYQLDIVNTPGRALTMGPTYTLLIGLPLLQCMSATRFHCLLARRVGQFSGRANRLVNWLCQLREIWPRYRTPIVETDFAFLPVRLLFSIYVPLYTMFSTAVVRLDELQADSYAMEMFSDAEVLDAITADTVCRVLLRESYTQAVRKPGVRDAAMTKSPVEIIRVLYAGLQADSVPQWIARAMSLAHQWNDLWPPLVRRLDNIGHEYARMDTHMTESAAEDYLATLRPYLGAALEGESSQDCSRMQLLSA